MSKYDIRVDKSADGAKVSVSGVIDEDVDFAAHPLSGFQRVDINVRSVKSINSCGIREWIKWLSSAGSAAVTYHECPKMIVDQINMVQGFLPTNGKVASFFVPYFSEQAGTEKNVLFTYGKEFTESGVTPPAGVKDDGGNAMEMDVVEAKYFKFLKRS